MTQQMLTKPMKKALLAGDYDAITASGQLTQDIWHKPVVAHFFQIMGDSDWYIVAGKPCPDGGTVHGTKDKGEDWVLFAVLVRGGQMGAQELRLSEIVDHNKATFSKVEKDSLWQHHDEVPLLHEVDRLQSFLG